jgi:GTP-binding protein Era
MRMTHIESVLGADAVLYVTPRGHAWEALGLAEPEFATLHKPIAHVISKQDTGSMAAEGFPEPRFMVSAMEAIGLDLLIAWCRSNVPEGPFRYDPDDVSVQPARFFVAEYVREAAFQLLSDELPYAVAAEVDEFREGSKPLYIRITLFVERPSQKNIVVGRGGATVREIGTLARRRIEELMGQQIFLDLWVKVLPKWRSKPSALARFGLPLITGKRT